jgi:hypothetical protein
LFGNGEDFGGRELLFAEGLPVGDAVLGHFHFHVYKSFVNDIIRSYFLYILVSYLGKEIYYLYCLHPLFLKQRTYVNACNHPQLLVLLVKVDKYLPIFSFVVKTLPHILVARGIHLVRLVLLTLHVVLLGEVGDG